MNNFEYKEFKLKEIASFEYGKMPDKTRLIERGYPVYSGYRIVGYYPEYMYEREKLLIIARGVGGTGDVKISPPHSYVTNLSIIFNENEEIVDYRYLYYYLSNVNMRNLDTGSCQSQITINQLEEYKVRLPKINIQHKLSKVLTTIESKIELNNRINSELEAMAKTIYDYWFVQFDFPDKKGNPYKTSGGKMVWNEELKREIPEGWESGELNKIGDIIGGSTPSKAIKENFCIGNGIPWITPKDLSIHKGKKYITRGELNVTESGLKSASLKIMPAGTVLLSSRAPIGYLAISRSNVTTNQGFKSFVPNSKFSTEFIFYTIKNLIPEIEANSSGSTFHEVSTSTLRTIITVFPSNDILTIFDKKIKPIFKQQDVLEEENQKLTELRDWLLPMLMNGQVKVGCN